MSSVRRTALAAASVAALAAATAASGQTAGETVPQSTATSERVQSNGAPGQGATTGASTARAEPATTVEDIVVTAQKRRETIQTVPIAVSAFTGDALKAQRIEGGPGLQQAVPNLTFSRAGFSESNFQIRGVGYQLINVAGDQGVGVHENNAPLAQSRLAEADFYDLERVEVLRGPQGTLYGRNSTGGVVNLITAKPTSDFNGSLTGDFGTYDTRRVLGFVNVPLGDIFSLRVAGDYLNRGGFQKNLLLGGTVDGRNLYSTRVTLGFKPTERLRGFLLWEHYQENDDRTGDVTDFCIKDPGPTSVGGVAVQSATARALLSRGCALGSIYSPAARGTPNTLATLGGVLGLLAGYAPYDQNSGRQSPNLRELYHQINPSYVARNDVYELDLEYDLTKSMKLTSLTSYAEDHLRNIIGGELGDTTLPFVVTPFTPGGVYNDPQLGPTRYATTYLYNDKRSRQWSEELRLQSSFAGPLSFNVGGIYYHLRRDVDSFVGNDQTSLYSQLANLGGAGIGFDASNPPNGSGHNYFLSRTPYELESKAAFGEVYYSLTHNVRITGGLRYTDDSKSQVNYPIQLLAPGSGFSPSILQPQNVEFKETTGRFNIDWRPKLSFTDQTLLYASWSRGYKGGGFNPPDVVGTPTSYAPEIVDAYEIGAKNTFLGGKLIANLTGFYYDYKGYQISQINALTSITVNVDAKVKGLEFESIYEPVRGLRFNVTAGYLDTAIRGGSSVDPFNRTQGDPSLTLLKSASSACVGPTTGVAALVRAVNSGVVPVTALIGACPSATAPNGAFSSTDPKVNPLAALGVVIPTSSGAPVNLNGKQLPQSPKLTLSVGAQYTRDLAHGWQGILRGDVYHSGDFYARYYNDPSDRVRGYETLNLSLSFSNKRQGIQLQIYARNVTNLTAVTGLTVNSDAVGLTTTGFLTDPRVIGAALTKTF